MEFFERTGMMAVGSRLRMLTDTITKDAARIYALYGVEIRPKWFPVFFVLAQGESRTITAIAREIRHSHPSVSNIVKEMAARKLVKETKDADDGRRNVVMLTAKGRRTAEMLQRQCEDVAAAVERIAGNARHDLWSAIGEWEEALAEHSLLLRVQDAKRAREQRDIRIVAYEPRFRAAFRELNEEWIMAHWQLEEADRKTLEHPQEYILDKGGYIFVALDKEEPVGVCALCRMEDPHYDYELAKYAVSPRAQGRGIGTLLGEAAIAKATALGAARLFLESNTLLRPAIHIYRKLGFRELRDIRPSYARGDIQMELELKNIER
ncbi:MAG: bifunctional helix-turn-helix transcriptional regulator/GNAT family N-acetyltransferase [Alistipes sp.]|nr:bifunctional helix-turn-helix transcriptional regulator/GNAT family N-acetyltransferase [Alistipes senegalensis]MCM1250353.1 bifunctional helix-turn-helix transcriptional regulator/GNAT family N-acetyltransferase [Alistipes sp.]